jgi:hypothetical protein
MLVAGVYLKGGYGVEMEWREKLRIAEERAKAAEEQAKVVMQALDGAIRSGGANTAVVVLPVMQAIEEQLKKQD